jgi:hypothetical protein
MADEKNTNGDFITYNLYGQMFENNENNNIQTLDEGFSGITDRSTPWKTLTELLAAYNAQNRDKIIELYNVATKSKAIEVYTGNTSNEILRNFSGVKNVNVLVGFQYLNGYLGIIEIEGIGINTNYFVQENGQYLLSALDINEPIVWNLTAYLKYRPEPLNRPDIVSRIDSLKWNEEKTIYFKLNKPSNWILLFKNKVNNPVLYGVQDGSEEDIDKSPGSIEIRLKGSRLLENGNLTIYGIESNYPVITVLNYMFDNATSFQIVSY